ncbi:unnamed protein product, partial [marine sediment metagenome]
IIDDSVCHWDKITINFDDFQPDATKIKFIDAFNIPAGSQLHRIIIHPTTAFNGAPITDAFVEIYEETDSHTYVNTNVNVFSAATDKSGKESPGYTATDHFLIDFATGNNIRMRLEVVGPGAAIDSLTQGSIDIYYKLDKFV